MTYFKYTDYKPLENIKELSSTRMEDAKFIFDYYRDKFEYRKCPICNSDDYREADRFLERYEVCICKICNSYYVNPIPSAEILDIYYNKCDSVKLYTTLHKTQHDASMIKDERTEFIFSQIENLLKNATQKVKILEVGCNTGNLIYSLRDFLVEKGYCDIYYHGIDLDARAIQIANELKRESDNNIVFENISTDNLEVFNDQFDVIISFDLMEHLIDPNEFCSQIYSLLKQEGLFLFAVPNSIGITELLLPYYYDNKIITSAIFPPMHLNGFSTQNINLFAYRNKFALSYIDTKGIFDIGILELCQEQNIDNTIKDFVTCADDATKAFLQYYTTSVAGGGYMRCVFKKYKRSNNEKHKSCRKIW
ncbi:class I SAM-dependent methyltransferase [Helicobacter equorum]|uniref:class I SAM-dependent methyltransferase n=1 Tax=Helicobacter equorum TaxID=361872 RepID=UPI000CF1A049|nr:class I SAM-dependent methyltransferase [Helicobacter equorum]